MSSVAALREEFAAVAADRERAGLLVAYLLLFVVTDAFAQVLPLHYRAVGVSIGALGVEKSVGNAVEVAMLAAFALAGGPALFLVGLALYVVQTTAEPAVLAYFFDQFDDDEEGRAWGVDGTVVRGVGVVAPAAGAALYGVDPRLSFGAGAASMAAATLVALTLPD